MAIDLDIITRLDRASARAAAREAQDSFRGTGRNIGDDIGDGVAKGISSKSPEIEKSLKKVADASGKVIVEQEKLNALKEKGTATDAQLIAQSEKLARAYRDETAALQAHSRAVDDHNASNSSAVASTVSLTAALGSMGTAAGKAASSFGQIGLVAAVGTLPAAVTAVVELGGALQQLAGAGAAVPGIFAGIAASVGTAALGMNGMKDAFDAVVKAADGTEASVQAANDALAGLSPNAADAVTTVVGLKGTFEDLRNMASQNMFAGFSGGLRDLVGNSLPEVTRGVQGISQGLNQNLMQVMTSLGSDSSQGFLDRILGNTGDAQSRLTAAIDPMVNAIGTLTAAGSDTLPRLADAVTAVAERFNTFITSADADGRLAQWIDQGLDGFTNLGNAVINIGTAFTGITQAAGGGQGLLPMLEQATARFSTFVNSTQGQNQLGEYFRQGRELLGQLLDLAQAAGPVLGGMLQGATSVARTFLPLISSILEKVNDIPGGAEAVVGAFVLWKTGGMLITVTQLATSLTNVGTVLGGLPAKATTAGKAMNAALKLAGPIAAAYALSSAYDGVMNKIEQITGTDMGRALGPGGGRFLWDTAQGPDSLFTSVDTKRDRAIDAYNNRTTYEGSRRTPYERSTFRRPGGTFSGRSADTPGLSSYVPPSVTAGGSGGGGSDSVPTFDPSQYAESPMTPGVNSPYADPSKVYDAETREMTARSNLESARLSLLELEAKGNATQRQLHDAKSTVQEKERALQTAQRELIEAQNGTYQKANDSISGAMNDLNSIFAPMDEGFGISGGLPGIAKWLATFLGNFALAGAIRSSPDLQAAALSMQSGGQGGYSQGSVGMPGGATGYNSGGGGYGGDAALLANVPAGRYTQGERGDLTQGLADCSSAVEDLVNLMDGRPTGGASMYTGNAAQWLTQRGFVPGMGGPGDMRVGYNSGHMQATLPGGTPFNWGSAESAARGGVGGTGADDPAFTDHYYRPAGATPAMASPSAMGPAALQPPPAAAPAWNTGQPLPAMPGGGESVPGRRQSGPGLGASAGGGLPQAASGGGGGGGVGLNDSMMAMAGGAADLVAPGSSIGLKLANRAIQFGGQAAAIGVSGALETFLPHGSALGDPGKSWLGKIAGGISGARPAAPNQAGKQAPQQQQGQQGQQGDTTNDNSVNIAKMETGGGDGQGVANDIGRMQYQQQMAGQKR